MDAGGVLGQRRARMVGEGPSFYHLSQDPLEGLVKPLHKAVSLGVVDGCPQVLYLQQPAGSLVCQDVFGNPHTG